MNNFAIGGVKSKFYFHTFLFKFLSELHTSSRKDLYVSWCLGGTRETWAAHVVCTAALTFLFWCPNEKQDVQPCTHATHTGYVAWPLLL